MRTKRTAKWHKKITLEELKHLREMGIATLEKALKTFDSQDEMRAINSHPNNEPCWECKTIAKKLRTPIDNKQFLDERN